MWKTLLIQRQHCPIMVACVGARNGLCCPATCPHWGSPSALVFLCRVSCTLCQCLIERSQCQKTLPGLAEPHLALFLQCISISHDISHTDTQTHLCRLGLTGVRTELEFPCCSVGGGGGAVSLFSRLSYLAGSFSWKGKRFHQNGRVYYISETEFRWRRVPFRPGFPL